MGMSKKQIGFGVLAVSVLVIMNTNFDGVFDGGLEPEPYSAMTDLERAWENYTDSSGVVHPALVAVDGAHTVVLGGGSEGEVDLENAFSQISVAAYVEPTLFSKEYGAEFRGMSAAELRTQPSGPNQRNLLYALAPFFSALNTAPVHRAISMKPTQSVSNQAMRSAFMKTLKPRLDANPNVQTDVAMNQFLAMYDTASKNENFKAGDSLLFGLNKDGQLSLSINDQISVNAFTGDLNNAFWGVFTDEDTAVPAATERFADRVPLIWSKTDVNFDITESPDRDPDFDLPKGLTSTTDGATTTMALSGFATQYLDGAAVNVALYVDTEYLASPDRTNDPEAQLTQIAENDKVGRSLRIVVPQSLISSQFSNALIDAMEPELKAALDDEDCDKKLGNEKASVRDLFPYRMEQGDTLYIFCDKDQTLGLNLNGDSGSHAEPSPEVCQSLFGAYLGPASLVGEDRMNMVKVVPTNPDYVPPAPSEDAAIPGGDIEYDPAIPAGALGSDINIALGFGSTAAAVGVGSLGMLFAQYAASGGMQKASEKQALLNGGLDGDRVAKVGALAKAKAFLTSDSVKLTFYLAVWYIGNIYYNIYNKKACVALGKNALGATNAHWLLSAVQLAVGVLFVLPMWATGIRKAPVMTKENWKEIAPVGLWASLAHAFSVLALGSGAVAFGQIVKSAEPVFAAATNAAVLRDIDHPMVYAALLPIIAGVGLASVSELSFSMTCLVAAMLANQAAALKNVVSKGVMAKPWAKGLGAQNTYSVVTILALICTLPFVAIFDLKELPAVIAQVAAAGTGKQVVQYSLLSGIMFYLYNEASFLCLSKLSPVTHSVGNTLKRVIIIVASCVVFKTPMTLMGGIGCGVAIGGTMLYSLAKKKFVRKPPADPPISGPPQPALA